MVDHSAKVAGCAGSNLGPYLICMAPLCSVMCLTAPLWDGYVPTEAIPDPHGQGPCVHFGDGQVSSSSTGISGGSWPLPSVGGAWILLLWVGFCLSLSPSQAQWDCVNAKYKQKKRNYKNSGVVVLADLKVSLGPAFSP